MRWSRALAIAVGRGLAPANWLLDCCERACVLRNSRFEYPPVFILGVPRSGTTLLSQALLARFRFAYLSNLHCRWYGGVLAADRLFTWLRKGDNAWTYQSRFGTTEGLTGPSECGEFWYRWFPRHPQHQRPRGQQAERLWSLRGVLAGLSRRRGAPLLLKNLVNTVRLPTLGQLLPEAVFVVCHRDPLATAASILKGRLGSRDPQRWWSVQPQGYADWADLPIEVQVARQVCALEGELVTREREFGSDRFHHVSYEVLCRAPGNTLDDIGEFVRRHGPPLQIVGEMPRQFEVSREPSLPAGVVDSMRSVLEGWEPSGSQDADGPMGDRS